MIEQHVFGQRKALWDDFCRSQQVIENSTHLFDTDHESYVRVRQLGKASSRKILSRSELMEARVISQTNILIEDIEHECNQFDGLIYMMFLRQGNDVIPLYIGKAESKGRSNPVSANIVNVARVKDKFARWGDNYQYHIGDLSASVLPGHDARYVTMKYQYWAKHLFITYPTERPQLKQDIWFWCKAWNKNEAGIWPEFGPIRLSFLEYLMIGVASSLFPETLLNREGHSRS
ncbi:hypothetical protein [Atlantibacter hermannii]|uniref:hypothetical protein n=1 Tax=Atlantibacter hermannii TaxID=565 RepID=UPI0022B7C80D|nr:hypothetical protein [Atlantibacter hermannii]MCZ7834981.1 hypothetical protein [Atlantibacter hermannii]